MISYAFVTIRFVTIVWLKFDNLSLLNSVTCFATSERSVDRQANRPASDEARTKVGVYHCQEIEKRPFPRASFVFHAREPAEFR